MKINRNNYEEYFISYIENELNDTERKAVEDFVALNPDLKNELELFGATKLVADEKIIFADKESLLQKNSTKIIAWKWNINVWASAAIFLLLLGVGWWMMNQSSVDSHQFSEVKSNLKNDSINNSKLGIQNTELKKQVPEKKIAVISATKKVKINFQKIEKQNFVTKSKLLETIDTAELPDSWKNQMKWQQEHEVHVVQEIKQNEIFQPKKIVAQIDTEKAMIKNIPTQKKSEEKILAQVPVKMNHQQHQIIKMLAWASGKISGNTNNDSNFDLAVGFVKISHREALVNN